jgi:hypothetical protein
VIRLAFAKHFETDEDFLFRPIYNAVTGDNKPYLEAILQYYKTHAVWILGVKTASYAESIIDAMGIPCVKSRHPSRKVRQ